jgi:hypothetical protein
MLEMCTVAAVGETWSDCRALQTCPEVTLAQTCYGVK